MMNDYKRSKAKPPILTNPNHRDQIHPHESRDRQNSPRQPSTPDDQLTDAPRPKALPDPAKTQPKLNEPNQLRPPGPPDFDSSPSPEERERHTLSLMDDYKRSKTRPTNPDQPQPRRPDTQPLETATAKTPPDTPTSEPTKRTKTAETDAELEARMHAQLDILEQAALKRFPELAQTD